MNEPLSHKCFYEGEKDLSNSKLERKGNDSSQGDEIAWVNLGFI